MSLSLLFLYLSFLPSFAGDFRVLRRFFLYDLVSHDGCRHRGDEISSPFRVLHHHHLGAATSILFHGGGRGVDRNRRHADGRGVVRRRHRAVDVDEVFKTLTML